MGARPVLSGVVSVDPIVVYPDPPMPELAQFLDLAGHSWKPIADEAAAAALVESAESPGSAAIITTDDRPEEAFAVARALRRGLQPIDGILLLVSGAQLTELAMRDETFDDFCLTPFRPQELEARLQHVLWRSGRQPNPEVVRYRELVLNLETYQAVIDGRALDLTYMEYELLKFLASNPGRVFSRETLLSRVWGYDYYGGARTVDVHIRRLRSKLGEEHAGMIQTLRSVGYRLGESSWAA